MGLGTGGSEIGWDWILAGWGRDWDLGGVGFGRAWDWAGWDLGGITAPGRAAVLLQ